MEEYGLASKINCITTDNGSVEVCAVSKMMHDAEFENLESLTCAAHTMHLAIHDGLKANRKVQELLNLVESVVKFFKKSTSSMVYKFLLIKYDEFT
jgi:hypothetical protein